VAKINELRVSGATVEQHTHHLANSAGELTGVKGTRDDKVRQLGDLITRFRSAIRGVYGPDSPVYEQAGGTRASARKSPARNGKAASTGPVTPQS
jgi:hypothetical protein